MGRHNSILNGWVNMYIIAKTNLVFDNELMTKLYENYRLRKKIFECFLEIFVDVKESSLF